MTEPTAEQFKIYKSVKSYLEHQADMHSYGYLSPRDSVYAEGESEIVIGGPGGLLDNPVEKYQEGYYRAAWELVEWAADRMEAAWIVYPILFVSRHALELNLKNLIVQVYDTAPSGVGDQHNIRVLWDMLLSQLQADYSYAVPKNVESITKVMSQLTEIDPKSMHSRYATKKDFETILIVDPQRLSLRNIQAIVQKLYNELYNILHTIEERRLYGSDEC